MTESIRKYYPRDIATVEILIDPTQQDLEGKKVFDTIEEAFTYIENKNNEILPNNDVPSDGDPEHILRHENTWNHVWIWWNES